MPDRKTDLPKAPQQGLEPQSLDPECGLFNPLPLSPGPPLSSPPSHWSVLLEHGLQPNPPLCFPQDFDLLLIFLADENDNHPLFTESTYQAEVMENSPAGRCQTHLGVPAAGMLPGAWMPEGLPCA